MSSPNPSPSSSAVLTGIVGPREYPAGVQGDDRLRMALDAMLDPYLLATVITSGAGAISDLVIVDANAAACAALGRERDDLVGAGIRQVTTGAVADDLISAAREVSERGAALDVRDHAYAGLLDEVEPSWFDVRMAPVGDGLGVTWRDVTEQHRAHERLASSESRFRLLAENASDFVYFADEQGRASWVAPTVTRTLGWSVSEIEGSFVTDLVHPDDWDVVAALREVAADGPEVVALRPGVQHPVLARLRQKDGRYRWMSVTATRVREHGSPHNGVVVGMRDVDELMATQALAERGQKDDLTGLVNRPFLLERMEKFIAECRRSNSQHAVLYCDVDHFKEINDTFGHAVGDEVLRAIAARIRRSVRDKDVVARLGGDEFVVVLQGVRGPADAEVVATKIRTAMREALMVDGIDLSRSFSIGVAMVRPDSTPDRVLRDADAALYEAQESGRDRIVTHRAHAIAMGDRCTTVCRGFGPPSERTASSSVTGHTGPA
jgi:diguanylate cyclase (GGDEF)-like protein/PAS domain S-box-containing protein